MSELSCHHGSEGYGTCGDVAMEREQNQKRARYGLSFEVYAQSVT